MPAGTEPADGDVDVEAAAGVFGEVNEEGPGGGDSSGCAVRLSCEVFRVRLMPERPIEPVGKRLSRLLMVVLKWTCRCYCAGCPDKMPWCEGASVLWHRKVSRKL